MIKSRITNDTPVGPRGWDLVALATVASVYLLVLCFGRPAAAAATMQASLFLVGAAGYFFGFRAGVLASAVAIAGHTVALNRVDQSGWLAVFTTRTAYHIAVILLGPAMGRLRSIGDRLGAEVKARTEVEQQMRSFVKHSPAAVAMFDNDMRYLVASQRWLVDCNLRDHSVIGKSLYELSPEIPERWKAIHRRCLAGVAETRAEDRLERADGTTRWVRWDIRPWQENNGDIAGIIMFMEVITDQKLTKERLVRSEAQYQFLVENIPDTITELDPEGHILFTNRGMYGPSVDDVIGTAVFDYMPENQIEDLRRVLADVVRTRRPRDYSFPLVTPEGTTWWSNRVVPVVENTVVVRLLVVGTDVTARRHMENTLRESEERYRKFFEDDLSATFIAAPGGNVIACNAEFAKVFGFEAVEEVLGVRAPDLYASPDEWLHFVQKLEEEQKLVDYATEMRNKHGETIHVRANIVGDFDDKGNLTEFRGHLFDNTAGRKLEEPLQRAQKMGAIGSGSEKILVAEDEPAVQTLIRDVLQSKGYEVLLAKDGEEALAVAAAHTGSLDMLVTDLVMPKMNGRELATRLRANNPGMKVLYISGHIGRANAKIGEIEAGTSFLSKPFSPGSLARKAKLLLDADSRLARDPVQRRRWHRQKTP